MNRSFTLFFLCLSVVINAQNFPGGGIDVFVGGESMKNPWAGGLDLPQFSASDINSDGEEDIIIFDRKANKWLIYLNEGIDGFKYAPQYEILYPEVINMGLIRDYNCDGLGDIVAHVNFGMQVFRNTNVNGNPSFVLQNPLLKYEASFGTNNIYKFNNDIAAAEDFDGDGDLDILSFDLLGTTIPYYRNLSVENGFGCDSLIFEENTVCWGNFKEGSLDNSIDLNFACKGTSGQKIEIPQSANRHTGSTLAVLDYDDDNDKDLLLGDVAFNNLVYLENGGSNLTANMISAEIDFPTNNVEVNVPIFPAAFYLDVNNDDKKDLLISPNSTTSSVNKDCVWFYENTGDPSDQFNLVQKNFLVETQIDYGSYSYPAFFDHNADGLLDMIVCNGYIYDEFGNTNGSLSYFENTGTAINPEFTLINENYQGINNFGLEHVRPTFGDLDGDGDDDLIIGETNGGVHFFENTGGIGNTANFVFTTINYFNLDVGTFSHPQLIDLNEDGLLDLVIGKNAPVGNVSYYRNFGTPTDAMFHQDTVNEMLGGIHVENPGFLFGYSSPYVAKKDALNKKYIYVGSDLGYIHKYEVNMDSLESGSFVEVDDAILELRAGSRTTVSINDINNDGELDFFIGNSRGGISFYSDVLLDSTLVLSLKDIEKEDIVFNLYPNPAQETVVLQFDNLERKNYRIQIFDILGKSVTNFDFNGNKKSIAVDDLSTGIYIVHVSFEGQTTSKKLVIK